VGALSGAFVKLTKVAETHSEDTTGRLAQQADRASVAQDHTAPAANLELA
jgi:hypothetical protein